MNQQEQKSQTQEYKNILGFIANPRVYLNSERETITHRLSENIRIEMPINLYKKILGISFDKKRSPDTKESKPQKRNSFGLIARPSVFLSKDGNYLIHSILGVRVSKHINFYKHMLGAEYTSKTKTA